MKIKAVTSSNKNKGIWAVLPLKGLRDAKNRLSNILSPQERAGLVTAMAQDMLSALIATPKLAGIMVISDSAGIKDLVQNYPVELIPEGEAKGLNGAISHAAKILCDRNIDAMMVIHGDIPLVRPQDIDAILETILPAPSVTITPCKHMDGTNVMVCCPPDVITFEYGKQSYSKHLKCAANRGIEPTEVSNEHLAIDIDTEGDLLDLLSYVEKEEIGAKTTAFLKELRITDRLG